MKPLFLLLALFAASSLHAQNNYAAQWKTADAFIQKKNLPKSALAVVKKIYAQAKAEGNEAQMLKALVYQTALQQETREGADSAAIADIEKESRGRGEPYASLYKSMAAGLYRRYFENHRWQLRNRTDNASADTLSIAKWTAADFRRKISGLYLASLHQKELLQQTPLAEFSALIVRGNVSRLRPTLYDLLAQKALDYFEGEKYYREIREGNYKISDTALFASAKTFASLPLLTGDTTSDHYRALRIYQELLAFHLAGENKDALIDADIARIAFVYHNATVKGKDSLYRQALRQLMAEHAGNKTANQAGYLLAYHHNEMASTYRPFGDSTHRYEGVKAETILQKIVADSSVKNEGWTNAYNLLNEIRKPSLSVTLEKVNLPGEPFRALVTYQNIAGVFARLIPSTQKLQTLLEDADDDDYWRLVSKQKPLRQWQQPLPATADLQEHLVEIKVDALPAGEYFLVLSDSASVMKKKTTAAANHFWVSSISYVNRGNDFFVLHRKTGEPLAGASVELRDKEEDKKSRWHVPRIRGRYVVNDRGFFHAAERDVKDYDTYLRFRYKGETLSLDDDVNLSRYTTERRAIEKRTQVYFYTDRSIYRPGQTVRFKAIVASIGKGADKSVAANQALTVYLYDVNDERRDSLKLTTNVYGSVADSFRLPQNLLNGNFSLRTKVDGEESRTGFWVEEYKRPKFFVAFDRIKTEFKIGDSVRLTLRAKAYAGNAVGGAKVSYNVQRSPRWTWRMPWTSSREQLAFGVKETDTDGTFTVSFKAEPDAKVDSSLNPVFNYTVTATVTDINGETHSETETVSIGYASLLLLATVLERSPVDSFKTLSVQTQNLQGEFAQAPLTVTLFTLTPEGRPLRKRYWERPDQFVMGKEEYVRHFPFDEYANESDYKTWPKAAVDSFAVTSNKEGKLPLAWKQALRAGHYLLRITATDKNGKEVVTEQHAELFDEGGSGKPEFFWLHIQGDPLKPGEHTDVQLASAANNVYLIKESDRGDKNRRDTSHFNYEHLDGRKTVRFEAAEADRGGYNFGFLFVKENRVYQYDGFVSVPWSNRQLSVALTTFRDKTEPGAKESWKLKIKEEGGKALTTEVLASMYDASLDAMQHHEWDAPPIWDESHHGLAWADEDFGINESEDKEFEAPQREHKKEYDAFLFGKSEYGRALWWLNPLTYTYTKQGEFYLNGSLSNKKVVDPKGYVFMHDMNPDVRTNSAANAQLMILPKPTARGEELAYGYFSGKTNYRRDNFGVLGGEADAFGNWSDVEVMTHHRAAPQFDAYDVDIRLGDKNVAQTQPRKNLSENAFFFPFLTTDANGDVEISFTAPEALTQWKFQAFAHTKDLAFGTVRQTMLTQKSLMVQPNVPCFVRQKDAFTLQAKISNLSNAELKGEARLQLFDAATAEPVSNAFGVAAKAVGFVVKEGSSSVVAFPVSVPADFNGALTWRVTASAEVADNISFSDGEEASLPVLPEKILLTETLPLLLRGNATKEVRLEKLLQSANSSTIRHQSLTVEATTNPAWYVVQALPYLMEFPYECAEQTWNRYYANALASIVAASSPQIEKIFERSKKDTSALASNLQKNEELKSALLQETPWLAEAKTEAAQKRKLALLFDKSRVGAELAANIVKLRQMQRNDGAFPWFPGGPADRYITQYIVTGIGKLLRTKGLNKDAAFSLERMAARTFAYLDKQVLRDNQGSGKPKASAVLPGISATEIQYLYLRSFFPNVSMSKPTQVLVTGLKTRLSKQWMKQSKQLQAMAAIALHRNGDKATPAAILASLKETAIVSEERGMYWKEVEDRRGFRWEDAPIETAALMVEAFDEVRKNQAAVSALLMWLIQQKQTNNWGSTKATADACYAVLLRNASLLNTAASVQIKLGSDVAKSIAFSSDNESTEEGTGYFKRTIPAEQVHSNLGAITVQTKAASNAAPVWANIYWQYFEKMEKATAASSPLTVRKELLVEKVSANGAQLFAIADTTRLKPGDKLKVRIQLTTDRNLEYVHLKDLRASCLEPVNVLSGYRWQNGVGYYEETKDASNNFFFDVLPKGTHVFEYPVYVAQSGNFTGGIATAQCMYAPQFAAHSGGGRVEVQ